MKLYRISDKMRNGSSRIRLLQGCKASRQCLFMPSIQVRICGRVHGCNVFRSSMNNNGYILNRTL